MPVALTPDQSTRATRIVLAFEDARGRLQAAIAPWGGLGPAPALFAHIGETLTWLCALDELLSRVGGQPYEVARDADNDGRAMRGLRFARNQGIHGADVVALAQFHGGAVPGLMVPGNAAPGQAPSYRWRPRAELPVPLEARPAQEAAYDAHLAGRELTGAMDATFAYVRLEAAV